MLRILPGPVKGVLANIFLITNLFFWVAFIIPVAIIKLSIPFRVVRRSCDYSLNFMCTRWADTNRFFIQILNDIKWDIQGDENLSMNDWYLVLSNHQSWADIAVLQFALNNRIPYFRFFLKQELIWMPVFNFVWLALDYPFMKRYSKGFLEKHPHLKGKDLETTRKSCEKFKTVPVAIMNFVEGTRYSEEKHRRQKSPYKHLLQPKAGGVAFVLSAIGEQLSVILDVTISYSPEVMGLWDFLCGRIKEIKIRIKRIPVTSEIMGDYFNDDGYRDTFQKWINKLWEEKDNLLELLKSDSFAQ
jgi:1-acyl-sn-glycerol-3-phosphate acyltransferase